MALCNLLEIQLFFNLPLRAKGSQKPPGLAVERSEKQTSLSHGLGAGAQQRCAAANVGEEQTGASLVYCLSARLSASMDSFNRAALLEIFFIFMYFL